MAKKPELLEVSYRPAKGGVVSETRTRTKRSGQGGGPDFDHESETGVHPSLEHAQAHMASVLSDCFTGGSAKPQPNNNPGEKE